MKRVIGFIFLIVILFSLTGCNREQKEELLKIMNQEIQAEEAYTPESYRQYTAALDEAQSVYDGIFSASDEIKEAQEKLQNALNGLHPLPDKDPLISAVITAKQIDTTAYIPTSVDPLSSAIQHANSVISNENSHIEDVENAIDQLNTAVQSLIPRPDKSALAKLIEKKNKLDESVYTTDSFTALTVTAADASSVLQDENATQSDVDTAAKNLKNCINGLVKATKGIYKIFYSLTLTDSNSVGNEWSKSITCNGSLIESGDTVAVPLNSAITITGTVTEHDSVPDHGSGSIRLTSDNSTQNKTIYVRENRGRYSGNLAVWQLEGSIVLLSTQ